MSLPSTSPPTVPVIATVAASLRRVDDVVGRDGVEGDARHRRHRVDRELGDRGVVLLGVAGEVLRAGDVDRHAVDHHVGVRHGIAGRIDGVGRAPGAAGQSQR